MKRILILILIFITCSACNSNSKKKKENLEDNIEDDIEPIVDTYHDDNNTEIGLYLENNNQFELVDEYKTNIIDGNDIAVFSIYPSLEKTLTINERYGVNFYNKWMSLENHENLKIGFNLKFTLDTGDYISYNILDPKTAIVEGRYYILAYLYDDYANRYSNWYSHIEEYEYNEESLFTALKLYACVAENAIVSKIKLTVFTYDGLDDFDSNDEYRGNSSYSITICDINKTC